MDHVPAPADPNPAPKEAEGVKHRAHGGRKTGAAPVPTVHTVNMIWIRRGTLGTSQSAQRPPKGIGGIEGLGFGHR